MKNITFSALIIFSLLMCSCGHKKATISELQTRVDSLQVALNSYTLHKDSISQQLQMVDSVDYNYFSSQRWDQYNNSHHPDVVINYGDGGVTVGINPQYVERVQPLFNFAPDLKIQRHRMSFGDGEWTGTVSEMRGTFSDTLTLPSGKMYPPNNSAFMVLCCTMARWKNGKIAEEYMFWDSAALWKQLGVM